MLDLADLHRTARRIFAETLKSVDAGMAVRRAVRLQDSSLSLLNETYDLADARTKIYSIAIGKAARPMASALTEILGDRLTAGVLTAPSPAHSQTNEADLREAAGSSLSSWQSSAEDSLLDRWREFEGGHPVPNLASLKAAQAAFDLLRRAEHERALVIFLISGGGSAMMEWPLDERTTLDELQATHQALVSCGASIEEINAVRRAISAVKGGRLALHAPHCDQISLIISDTGMRPEATVASGPTYEFSTDDLSAASVIARYELEARLPASILRAIEQPYDKIATASQAPFRRHYVLLDNERALAVAAEAARAHGFTVELAHELSEQPIAEGCSALLSRLFDLHQRRGGADSGICLISGGEFACPVRGQGTGGRNSESALRWAIELEARFGGKREITHVVALSAGTDGIDGNSPAAGAIADETTLSRARLLKLDAKRFLEESDAFTFFDHLGETIVTGPTGTNVRDVRIMLAS